MGRVIPMTIPDPSTTGTAPARIVVVCSVCGHRAHPETPAECGSCPEGYCCAREFEAYRDPAEDGCHHFRDPSTCDVCAEEKIHGQHVDYRVKMLDECVNDAERAVRNATTHLRELVSGDAWYIELAEGTEGTDALDDLAAAARLLRNVGRIVREHKRLLKEM